MRCSPRRPRWLYIDGHCPLGHWQGKHLGHEIVRHVLADTLDAPIEDVETLMPNLQIALPVLEIPPADSLSTLAHF